MKRMLCLFLVVCCFAAAVPAFARQKQTSTQKIMKQQQKSMAKRLKAQRKAQKKQMKQNRKRQERRSVSGGF